MQFQKDLYAFVKLLLFSNVLYVLKLICFPFSFLVLIWVYEKGQTFVILRINFISSFSPKKRQNKDGPLWYVGLWLLWKSCQGLP